MTLEKWHWRPTRHPWGDWLVTWESRHRVTKTPDRRHQPRRTVTAEARNVDGKGGGPSPATAPTWLPVAPAPKLSHPTKRMPTWTPESVAGETAERSRGPLRQSDSLSDTSSRTSAPCRRNW